MEALKDPGSVKRLVILALTALVTLVRPFLDARGIPVPDDASMAVIGGVVATYLIQSSAHSIAKAKIAGQAAAAQVDNVAKADAVIAAHIASDAAPTPPRGSP